MGQRPAGMKEHRGASANVSAASGRSGPRIGKPAHTASHRSRLTATTSGAIPTAATPGSTNQRRRHRDANSAPPNQTPNSAAAREWQAKPCVPRVARSTGARVFERPTKHRSHLAGKTPPIPGTASPKPVQSARMPQCRHRSGLELRVRHLFRIHVPWHKFKTNETGEAENEKLQRGPRKLPQSKLHTTRPCISRKTRAPLSVTQSRS